MTRIIPVAAVLLALLTATTASGQTTVTEFTATINNLGAIAPGGAVSTETGMAGFGRFTLTQPESGAPTLAYELTFAGVDFTGTDGLPGNDVTAIHIHDTTGVDHSANTPHVLNIFGFPSIDDADSLVMAAEAQVTGLWDDSDLTDPALPHAGNPMANSDTLTSSLDALLAGELFLMLHTTSPNALPGTPGITIGGQIVPVPEPTTAVLATLAVLSIPSRRRG